MGLNFADRHEIKNRAKDAIEDGNATTDVSLKIRAGLFDICILDEMHKIKGTTTQQHTITIKMGFTRMMGLTASPFQNRLRDLEGVLNIVWEMSVKKLITTGVESVTAEPDYQARHYQGWATTITANGSNYLSLPDNVRSEVLPALHLLHQVWEIVLETVSSTLGLADFREPHLFFTAKGTKLSFQNSSLRPTMLDVMKHFESFLEPVIDMRFVEQDRFYVDLGKEICAGVSLLPSAS